MQTSIIKPKRPSQSTVPAADSLPTPNKPRYDVVALGELLVDLTQRDPGRNPEHASEHVPAAPTPALYERNPGGAPANVAAACARQGLAAAFLGKVGDDPMGAFALEALSGCGADVSHVVVDPTSCTTLAFATLVPGTDSYEYAFVRKPGADQLLRPDELGDLPQNARVLHVGSLSLTHEPARSTTLEAVRRAHDAGVLVSYDPNYRAFAWDSPAVALEQMLVPLPLVDILKVNEDEAPMLFEALTVKQGSQGTIGTIDGTPDIAWFARMASAFLQAGPRLVAITLGGAGALLATRNALVYTPGFRCTEVRDTTGAGDNFCAGMLAWLLRDGDIHSAEDLDLIAQDQLAACARYACAAASLSVERPGGMTSSPTAEETHRRALPQEAPTGHGE